MFNDRDSQATVDASKNILDEIQNISDNRTVQEIIDDQFIPIDDSSLDSEIENMDVTSAWDPEKTTITNPGPIIKLSTDYNRKVKAANKIKKKYIRKK